jgi:hypothetical protein
MNSAQNYFRILKIILGVMLYGVIPIIAAYCLLVVSPQQLPVRTLESFLSRLFYTFGLSIFSIGFGHILVGKESKPYKPGWRLRPYFPLWEWGIVLISGISTCVLSLFPYILINAFLPKWDFLTLPITAIWATLVAIAMFKFTRREILWYRTGE